MRLTSITLRNYRGITEHTVDFADGITVVEGPNEVGKSSIPEALRLLRTEYDSAKKQIIRDIRPVHRDASPEVEARLTSGPYDMTYRKRWGKGGLTELTVHAPRREMLTGRDAHDRFEQILDETLDIDLLDALEVQQGKSLDQPLLADLTALHRALGNGDDTADDDILVAAIHAEQARYFTGTGKPTGEYRAAIEAAEASAVALRALRERSAQVDGWVDAHARFEGKAAALAQQLDEARAAHAALATKHAALAGLRAAVTTAEEKLNAARAAHRHAVAAQTDRAALIAEHQNRTDEATAAGEALEAAAPSADGAAQLAEAERSHQAALDRRAAAGTRLRDLRHARDLAERRMRRASLRARLTKAEAADDARREALATLAQEPITAADVRRLEQAELALGAAEQARRAAAAVVEVTPLGDLPVVVGGTVVEGPDSRSVLEPTSVRVDGVVEVTVRPGQRPEALEATLTDARDARDQLLRSFEVESLEEAEARAAAHDRAQDQLREAERALELVLVDVPLDQLRDQLAAVERSLEGEPAAADDEEAQDWEALLAEATAQQDSAMATVDEAQESMGRLRRALDAEASQRTIAEHRVSTASAELDRITTRLGTAREAHPDDELAATVEAATEAVDDADSSLAEHRRALAESDADRLELEFDNATQLVDRRGAELQSARNEVLAYRTRLDDAEREGLFDALTRAEAEHIAAVERRDRIERAASAAKLLASTFDAHRTTAQAAYVAPFKAAIERLGTRLHGNGFEVEVSPDLQLESRTVDGRTVGFHQLSGGAQEQLALLGRLAAAQLVAEQGAPVILDDALGFADPERLRALALVLHEVGQTAQIILLTCQSSRYAEVGSATVVSLSND